MKELHLDSVRKYNELYGLPTKHPLVAAIGLTEDIYKVNHVDVISDFYGLYMFISPFYSLQYGRKKYDLKAGTVICIPPGKKVGLDLNWEDRHFEMKGILFHPDLLLRTSLAKKIKEFSFFNYDEIESLHISEDEKEKFIKYYNSIREELDRPADKYTNDVITSNIHLVLDHLQRFYDRQFATRRLHNTDVVDQLQEHLRNFFSKDYPEGAPTVAYFADKVNLSPSYFSDLIRKLTGSTPKEFISRFIMEEAKRRLVETREDIGEIAYRLGFNYPAHFSRMFKRVVGLSPKEFRLKN